MMFYAPTITWLIAGRLVVGLGVGVASQIVPLYIAEVAPDEIRGKLVAFNNAMVAFAQFLSAVTAYFLIPHWRWMLGIAAVPSIIQFIGMFFLPESPRWLGKKGRDEEQQEVIKMIYKPEH